MTALSLENLQAGYDRDLPIVKGVSFAVSKTEAICILGPNGAGKSTMIKAIAGLVPCFGGKVRLGETEVTGLPPHVLVGNGMGFVPQTENIFTRLTILENLQIAAQLLPRQARAGRIEAPIGRDARDASRRSIDTDFPQEAISHFVVQELLPTTTLLRLKLETGRTHQIRVHLEAIGHPVVADPTYGTSPEFGLDRQFLHAARLTFPHPRTGEPVEVASPLPEDLQEALALARREPVPV